MKLSINFILIGVLFFFGVSCKKESQLNSNSSYWQEEKKSPDASTLADSVGYYHTQVMAYMLPRLDTVTSNHYKPVESRITNYVCSNYSYDFTTADCNSKTNYLDSILTTLGVISGNNLTVGKNAISAEITYLHNAGEISSRLTNELHSINTMAWSDTTTFTHLMDRIDNLVNFENGENDAEYISACIQVADSSYALYNENPLPEEICDLCVVWGDAAGALYGLLAGPVGSIIEGAVFSSLVIINEQ